MGQGHSQPDKPSDYAAAPKGSKKSKRKSSSKSASTTTTQSQSSRSTASYQDSRSASASESSSGKKSVPSSQSSMPYVSGSSSTNITNTTTTTNSTSARNGCPPSSLVVSSQPTGAVHHRGSFSSGGESRGVPSRQFSLTRQTPAQTTTTTSSSQNKHAQIEKYFNKYKDREEDSILAEGMEKFCVDLGVDPTEFIVLVLAWKFEASQMCRFTREEFINGCQKMQAHNAKSLKERFPELLAEAKDRKNFKDLYNFTFSFGLDHSSGQRSLPIEMAVPLWDLVFTQNRPDILDRWFDFLKESEVRGVSRDTWNMFLPFIEITLPDLSNYDETEAWPSLFDDFVEGEQERTTL